MKTLLKTLCLLTVVSGVLMKSKDVFKGTVGESVEIECPYPDGQQYTPKYFCRHPCSKFNPNVLIETDKLDQVVSSGRYSIINTVTGRFFTVTISKLNLKDSGVYYCGLNQWGRDTLKKVNLQVHPVSTTSPDLHSSTNTSENTHTVSTWTTTHSADNSRSPETLPSKVHSTASTHPVEVSVVCAGVLMLLVFCVLVALVFLYRRRSDSKSKSVNPPTTPENPVQDPQDLNQTVEDVSHLYDEVMTMNSVANPPKEARSSVIYSTVQHCNPEPPDDPNSFYSLLS